MEKFPKKKFQELVKNIQYHNNLYYNNDSPEISDAEYDSLINDYKNIKKLFSYADKNNFSFILLIGEEEINSNKIILKDLKNKSQQTFEISKFELKNEIR